MNVPRLTKRAIEAALVTAATCAVSFIILVLNNVLTGRGGWVNGLEVWLAFVRRPDILGTIVLTAICSVAVLHWYQDGAGKR